MFNQPKKRSFFEKLTGVTNDDEEMIETPPIAAYTPPSYSAPAYNPVSRRMPIAELPPEEEEELEGQLTADVYQTNSEIIIQTMTAGVRPDDLNISITPEKVSISGKREAPRGISEEDYFYKELYWGAFSRTIVLPQEVVAEEAEAVEKHGLLIIRLPKLDKNKQHRIKIKSL
ncbi:MAG: Hsp20/alpha crystallin family protein [Parcubacteria group bacterium]|nr:Hsp20/alpha crystallin family protein [Parcubacteria group bacterium]